jgi:insertion element IS1 protein InsB
LLKALSSRDGEVIIRRADEVEVDEMWSFVGKRNTQKIERKPLTLRTRSKRLTRKTMCFSKSVQMHDIVIRLFVNRYQFRLPV